MNSTFLKKILPHVIAIVVFLILSAVYCKPSLEGKVLNQSDVIQHKGMAKQSDDFRAKYGHYPLWTESPFSGMPAFTIAYESSSTFLNKLVFFLYSFSPFILLFFACTCFYFLTQVLSVNPWVGIIAGLAFGYSTFDPIILAVGHNTQMAALAFMPAVVAGFLIILQKKYLTGAAIFSVTIAWQASVTQHVQIVYYTILIIGFIALAYLYKCVKEKLLKDFFIAGSIATVAAVIGICGNAVAYLPVQEYAKETMRGGKSELTQVNKDNKSKGGLDKDYAFMWSYEIPETATLILPGAYGGGDVGHSFSESAKTVEKMGEIGLPEESAIQFTNGNAYWGSQPSTAGPVYLGAVIIFIFIFSLFTVRTWHLYWIIPISVLAIVLAWGKNFSGFNYIFFDYFPFYNKFRAPTMALVIPQLTFPLFAAMGIDQLIKNNKPDTETWKKFRSSVIVSAVILGLLGIMYLTASYKSQKDSSIKDRFSSGILQRLAQGHQPTPEMQQQANEVGNGIVRSLQSDRQSLFGADLLRTFVLIGLAVVLLGYYLKRKLKPLIFLAGLGLLISFDVLAEDRKYLNEDSFIDPVDIDNSFQPTTADAKILQDPDKNFRVFDRSGDAFVSSQASYYHNSIGGYSPAKLALYNDIIENQLSKGNLRVYNMLNTKYIISPDASGKDVEALLNPNAYGACWLVKGIKYVDNADQEMKALDSTDLRDTAVVRKVLQKDIPFEPVADSSASLRLIENLNDKIDYSFNSGSNQFAVFSEIYYDKGWNAYLDGKKTVYVKVNYVLRGMPIPAGKHTIEFRFEPRSVILGTTITWIASTIISIIILAAIVAAIRNSTKKNAKA